MRVLVTGSSSVAAKALQEIQNEFNHEFIFSNSKICDSWDVQKVDEYFNFIKPDSVINLAASGGIKKIAKDLNVVVGTVYKVINLTWYDFIKIHYFWKTVMSFKQNIFFVVTRYNDWN